MGRRMAYSLLFVALFSCQVSLALAPDDERHLLERLSFGVNAHPQLNLKDKDKKHAVNLLLESVDATINVEPPGWLAYTLGNVPSDLPITEEANRKFKNNRNKLKRQQREALKAWWLRQIHQGNSPVAERLILFWHNYFTTQIDMLHNPKMSWQQQLVLRRHVFGNYRHMLRAMNEDPALLWYLDNHINNKKKPNENYARELLELYTLGEGNYIEHDVKELARTMTGAGVDTERWLYQFRPERHDSEIKDVLGVKGNLEPNQVIDIVLRKPRAAQYLVERLWLEFVSPTLDKKSIELLAKEFRANDFNLRELYRKLFEHPVFWHKSNRLTLVKSPVELLVATHLSHKIPVKDYAKAVVKLKEMGQDLFNPPDVGGWPEGEEWINSVRLAKRHDYQISIAKPTAMQLQLDYQLK